MGLFFYVKPSKLKHFDDKSSFAWHIFHIEQKIFIFEQSMHFISRSSKIDIFIILYLRFMEKIC